MLMHTREGLRNALTASIVLMACGSPSRPTQDGGDGGGPMDAVCSVPEAGPSARVFQCEGAQATGAAPVIADFEQESAPLTIYSGESRSGAWYSYTDGTSGCISSTVVPEGSGHVLRLTGGGFSKWGAGFGTVLSWSVDPPGICLYDASHYAGVRFRAKGNAPLRMVIPTRATTFQSIGGDCPDAESCFDQHGRTLALTSDWQTYEAEFCSLSQEGWGGNPTVFDPTLIVGVNFHIRSTSAFDVSFDDFEFVEPMATSPGGACKPVCPLDEVPPGVKPDPESTPVDPATGVALHTFEQVTPDCGSLTRRYLVYVPKGLPSRSAAPVLIALPGKGSDAENLRDFMTHERFEWLADRDRFIVVYGNAAPSTDTMADWPNGGSWRTEPGSEVDDQAYLSQVVSDLEHRAVIDGTNRLFLVGQSNGGGMVLSAARATPTRYAGFAAIMPYAGFAPHLPDATAYSLEHIFLAYSDTDPGTPAGYSQLIAPLGLAWARAIGVSESDQAAPDIVALDDTVAEGSGYTGTDPVVLATRDSRAQQVTYGSPTSGAAVRVVEFDHAGHFWPQPDASDPPEILATFGLRNQDLYMSDALWDFLKSAP